MSTRVLIGLFFFLSGAAGLVYQVVWSKQLGLILGNTVYSLTIVLGTFMGGLGLGSAIAARTADRIKNPLLLYGILEGIIGIYCALIPALVAGAETLFRLLSEAVPESRPLQLGIRLLVASLFLLLPTTLMGATLPILSRIFVRRPEALGRSVALLYAVNTFGAVAGSLAAGFVLIPAVGLAITTYLAAAANVLILILSVPLSRNAAFRPPAEDGLPSRPATRSPSQSGAGRIVLIVIALAGAASMVDQIAWTRVLSLCLGSSVYAFSIMVGTFIFGLALGSALVGRLADRTREPLLLLGLVEMLVGVSVLGTVWVLGGFPLSLVDVVADHAGSFSRLLFEEAARVALLLIVPTALMGAAFPLAARAFAGPSMSVARAVGTVYAWNTLGAIAGSVLGGFVCLPLLGSRGALLLAAGVNLGAGALCAARRSAIRNPVWRLPLGATAVAGVLLLIVVPSWDPGIMTCGPFLYAQAYRDQQAAGMGDVRTQLESQELLFYRDGMTATVTVTEDRGDGSRSLAVNGKVDASTSDDMNTQLLLGHLPVLLHPETVKDLLVVGLGSGATLAAALRHSEVERVDCLEISSGMVDAAREFFTEINDGVLEEGKEPRVRLLEDDARNFISLTDRKYHVITSEPSNPWLAGIGNLFSVEFFELCRSRLEPGGIMCQWIHSEGLSPSDFKVVVRTFVRGFEDVLLFETLPAGDYLLIGSDARLSIDVSRVVTRLKEPSVESSLERIGMTRAEGVLSTFVAARDKLVEFVGDGVVHTDDNAYLEFSAPRSLLDRNLFISQGQDLLTLTDEIVPRLDVSALAPNERDRLLEALQGKLRGRALARLGAVHLRVGDVEQGSALLAEAHALLPDDGYLVETLVYLKVKESRAFLEAGRAGRCERLAREALQLRPEDGRPQETLGCLELARGRLEEAIRYLEESVKLRPGSSTAWTNLGVARMRNNELDEAEACLRKADGLRGGFIDIEVNLGHVLLRQGKLDEASEFYRIVLDKEPADLDAVQGLYMVLNSQGRQGEARDVLREARGHLPPEQVGEFDRFVQALQGG